VLLPLPLLSLLLLLRAAVRHDSVIRTPQVICIPKANIRHILLILLLPRCPPLLVLRRLQPALLLLGSPSRLL
jgi:hypothetical protein